MTSFDSDPQCLAMVKSAGPAHIDFVRSSAALILVLAASLSLGGCAALRDVRDWFSHDAKPPPPVIATPVTPPPPVPTQLPKPKPVTHEIAKPEKPPEKLAEVD